MFSFSDMTKEQESSIIRTTADVFNLYVPTTKLIVLWKLCVQNLIFTGLQGFK